MNVGTGLDRWVQDEFGALKGQRIGLLCHQASFDSRLIHVLDCLIPYVDRGDFQIGAVFGPQHGIWGHTQDNMIEWEGYTDPRTGLPFYSLYGEHRRPTPVMLAGLDRLVVDLQDVGARYYTFIWTLAHCMEACAAQEISITVLDRPNPISGSMVEGPGLDLEYRSFVGLYPLPVRHGLTIGEIARYLADVIPGAQVDVIECHGWNRDMFFDETGLKWGLPSPNMPTPDTALVYPGQCLLEGTKLSEGRGTTRPFEIFGAPFVDPWQLCRSLNSLGLEGAVFRPVSFCPTFQKFKGEYCGGAFIHVTDRNAFRPVLTTAAILTTIKSIWPGEFAWQDPPYEYEYEKLPIDILSGGPQFREMVEAGATLDQLSHFLTSSTRLLAEEVARCHFY